MSLFVIFRHFPPTHLLTELKQWDINIKCYKPSRTHHLGHVVVLRNRLRLIKQVCFITLENDIFGGVSSTTQV